MAEAESRLTAGQPEAALARLEPLFARGLEGARGRTLEQAARCLITARKSERHGKFGLAEQRLAEAAALCPEIGSLDELRQACRLRGEDAARRSEQLHEALAAEDWSRVLAEAEALLQLCPAHGPATVARRRAWRAVGIPATQYLRATPSDDADPIALRRPSVIPMNHERPNGFARDDRRVLPDDERGCDASQRFLLWIDGVGGYLACLGDALLVGQPLPGNGVDIPILADISRRHAKIRREADQYLLHAIRPVTLNGKPADQLAPLRDGHILELGDAVRLRFRRPHALSSTARLEFVSHHRLQPAVDAVLLVAESCILGPSADRHVVCRGWQRDVVLSRRGDQLYCRYEGSYFLDGELVSGRQPIAAGSHVAGDDFSFSLEAVTDL